MVKKSIVLIGFMGVGKTTVGKEIARKLNRNFVDIDHVIEREFNMPTTEIFKEYGEETFRKKEKELIKRYTQHRKLVISVGGGAFLQEEVKYLCLSSAVVVFLNISWDTWKDRIYFLTRTRPNLQGKSIEEIKQLFIERQPIYKDHHIKIDTDNLNIGEAAYKVINALGTI
ncbi:shikimate kinase [Oceanobacillus halophilus]|uniref:Shikimate kinase n=1 Tax=Oceanobacillus halophilus TaxID=930130 RepID=A0A495AAJ2_9BACI|nr:shikimate kinase [Oceanobacillus halophilus]RKQ35546.1 shikimate kinase [Oceanobacillus halophilus]